MDLATFINLSDLEGTKGIPKLFQMIFNKASKFSNEECPECETKFYTIDPEIVAHNGEVELRVRAVCTECGRDHIIFQGKFFKK